MRLFRLCLLLTGLGLAPLAAQQPTPPPATPAPSGRITGRVVDRETGRPVQGVRVMLVGQAGVVETDLDGRYRTPPVAAGLYAVRAMYIGYNPVQRDSIKVVGGQTVTVDFALTVRAVELDELAVEAAIPVAPKTDAGLLAAQQAAPSVSDGISAEAISRSPDGDGGDVIRRVTGVAVFDRKFVVVRGLNERYSTTTLNGADLPSPEPLKKVAPLDIFPASLLESIVTAKPRETVVVMLSKDELFVQGERVASIAEVRASEGPVAALRDVLQRPRIIGQKMAEKDLAEREVTVMADKTLPYEVLKKVMQTATDAGFGKISFATIEKDKALDAGAVVK